MRSWRDCEKRMKTAHPRFPDRTSRLPKPLGKTPRIGRIQRAVRRGFIASQGEPLSTSQLVARAYPRLKAFAIWQYAQVRSAAARWCVRIGRVRGRRGIAVLWSPNAELRRAISGERNMDATWNCK